MDNIHISRIEEQSLAMEPPYSLQSRIYGAASWAFLFGRRQAIRTIPIPIEKQAKILEVGCGTGHNLRQLARWFPNARITGLDASPHMIAKAARATARFQDRVQLVQEPYACGSERFNGQMDAVLFSYSLARAGSNWRQLVQQAKEDLRPGGYIAVVDFHDSSYPWFKALLGSHYPGMGRDVLPFLSQEFTTLAREVGLAYGGFWEYFTFLGRKEFSGATLFAKEGKFLP